MTFFISFLLSVVLTVFFGGIAHHLGVSGYWLGIIVGIAGMSSFPITKAFLETY